jgi:hypothetical protein
VGLFRRPRVLGLGRAVGRLTPHQATPADLITHAIHVHETPSEVLAVEQRMRAAAAPHPVNVFTMELSVSGHGIRITETEAAQEHLLA